MKPGQCGFSTPLPADLMEAVNVFLESRCNAASQVPLPARMPNGSTYVCGRAKGHEGLHRWPEYGPAIAEWEGDFPYSVLKSVTMTVTQDAP